MAQDDTQTIASSVLYGGVGHPIPNVELPAQVPAPLGKLTLFADFSAKDTRGVPLFLVNRTDQPMSFESQDGDIYLKLEHRLLDGRWERAQTHTASDCGNSYVDVTLNPGQHFRFYGYKPAGGVKAWVRYACPSNALLVSNEGDGFVLEKDIQESKVDSMERNVSLPLSQSLDTTTNVRPELVTPPRQRVAALRLLQVFEDNVYFKKCSEQWAHDIESKTSPGSDETEAAITINHLLAGDWPSEHNSDALLHRCIEALQNKSPHTTEFGLPEECPALVWQVLEELSRREFHTHSRMEGQHADPSEWKAVMDLADGALDNTNREITHAAANIVSNAPLSDELLKNIFFEKHLWSADEQVQRVCANTLSRRDARQELVAIAWKLSPGAQVIVLGTLAYPSEDLEYTTDRARDPRFDGEEKFWTYCMETMPIESTYALTSAHSFAVYNPFNRIVHDPLHNYFARETDRSDALANDFKIEHDPYMIRMAVEFLASWQMEEDTPILQKLLRYKGYQIEEGSRGDSSTSNQLKPFVLHAYAVREAAKTALLKRGVPVPSDLLLKVNVTP